MALKKTKEQGLYYDDVLNKFIKLVEWSPLAADLALTLGPSLLRPPPHYTWRIEWYEAIDGGPPDRLVRAVFLGSHKIWFEVPLRYLLDRRLLWLKHEVWQSEGDWQHFVRTLGFAEIRPTELDGAGASIEFVPDKSKHPLPQACLMFRGLEKRP